MKKTALYNWHKENGKIVAFAGYLMPIVYSSIKNESIAVRNYCGVFDVSHMGKIKITGKKFLEFVDYVFPMNIKEATNGKALYGYILNENGGVLDDLILYKFPSHILVIVNAINTCKVLNKLQSLQDNNIEIEDQTSLYSIIAIQGPHAKDCISKILDSNISLKRFNFIEYKDKNYSFLLARTGYTGEDGYEIIVYNKYAEKLWQQILKIDKKIVPCGLGARDVLRLEAGYPLYGHELNENITPLHVGGSRFVDFNKEGIGIKSLRYLKENISKSLCSFVLNGKHIARPSDRIFLEGLLIGEITSGTYSFNFNKSIAMGFVEKDYLQRRLDKVIIKHNKYESEAIILKTSILLWSKGLNNN